jgi:hypothetical protein
MTLFTLMDQSRDLQILRKNWRCWGVFIATALSVAPLGAQAATHEFRGCVSVEDTLDSPAEARLEPLASLQIKVDYEVLGVFLPMVGTVTTNSSGCFFGEIRGFTVPANTRLRLTAKLKNDRQGVRDERSRTYDIDLGTRSVSEGTTENFGSIEFTLANSSDATHGAMLMWLAQNRAIDRFESHVESWDLGRLWVKFPADQTISTGGQYGLNITADARDRFSSTFLHELGHFVSDSDVFRSGSGGDYCTSYTSGSYPKGRPPYTYHSDAEYGADADCFHNNQTYEVVQRAVIEGYADGFSDYLSDQVCSRLGSPTSLNFDGKNREAAFKTLVCRAVDSGSNQRQGLHAYGQTEDHLRILEGREFEAAPLIEGDQAILGQGSSLYTLDLSDRSARPVLLYQLLQVRVEKVEEVFRLEESLCVRARLSGGSSKTLLCKDGFFASEARSEKTRIAQKGKSKSGKVGRSIASIGVIEAPKIDSLSFRTLTPEELPVISTYQYLMDVQTTEDYFYALYYSQSGAGRWVKLMRAPRRRALTSQDWVERVSIQTDAPFYKFVVSETDSEIFLGSLSSVYKCAGVGCSSVRLFAGDEDHIGYKRGPRGDSRLGILRALQVVGSDLYIADHYGVSKVPVSGSASSSILEQVAGAGPDEVFLNNLSLRSLAWMLVGTEAGSFGVSEDWILLSGSYNRFEEDRSSTQKDALFVADRKIPVVSRTY